MHNIAEIVEFDQILHADIIQHVVEVTQVNYVFRFVPTKPADAQRTVCVMKSIARLLHGDKTVMHSASLHASDSRSVHSVRLSAGSKELQSMAVMSLEETRSWRPMLEI